MYQYEYKTLSDLAELAERYGVGLSEVILRHETETTERTEEDVHDLMAARLAVFRESIRSGLVDTEKSVSGLVGGDAAKLEAAGARLLGPLPHRAATYAIAINEANAKMFKIVACPTAGSCGILPAALIAAAEILGKSDEECLRPLYGGRNRCRRGTQCIRCWRCRRLSGRMRLGCSHGGSCRCRIGRQYERADFTRLCLMYEKYLGTCL